MAVRSKENYEKYLNSLRPSLSSHKWFIGGIERIRCYPGKYGTAIRKYDPVAFDEGYEQYKIDNPYVSTLKS